MSTLNWIGRKAVVNHHKQVPFHLLKDVPELSAGDPGSGNLLVEGDNLLALKALLPYYAGQVKCIYIDPPYNTGSENWVYNDNVNSPEMREWLGKVVGRDGEDLSRHDKWLCMMYPRLSLLRNFLRDDGAIFVSLDDNEIHRARFIMDEIFGEQNFVEQFVWKKSYGGGAKEKYAVRQHEYCLMYAFKKGHLKELWLPPDEEAEERYYKYRDEKYAERGPYRIKPLEATKSMDRRENLIYPILSPDGVKIMPKKQWWWSKERVEQALTQNEIVFTKTKNGISISYKQYLRDESGEQRGAKPFSIIDKIYTQQGTADLRALFDDKVVLQFPKPVKLIEQFVYLLTHSDPNAIVLDSFAGSGTTGQAVFQLNKKLGGNRRFVLVEMDPNICRNITAKRLRQVTDGYKNVAGEKIDGQGNGFRFTTLSEPLFDERGNIRSTVRFADLARHVYFTETGEPLPKQAKSNNPLIGVCNGVAVYLLYNGILKDKTADGGNVLTASIFAHLNKHNGPKVIYGTACRIGPERLRRENIVFKQLPYKLRVDAP
jgi:site-specific DNA-methyltransferase (adenine-specific)/adenine-specific DNA-methyltransferase